MEYKMKCNVCGKIFCYTDEDLKQNASNAGMAALSALGGLASTLGGGTILHTHHLQGQADRYNDKVVDYNQCPYCHSRDLSFYHGEDNTQGKDSATLDAPAVSAKNINTTASTESLLKRAFIFLEDGDWASADAYSESCLDRDPELAEAYLAKLMVEKKAHSLEELGNSKAPLSESKYYQKAIRYGNDIIVNQLKMLCENAESGIKRLAEIRERLNNPDCSVMITVSDGHVAAICADGSVQSCGRNLGESYAPDKWKDMVFIETGYSNTVGLRADGMVVACGKTVAINQGVSKWRDIKSLRIGGDTAVGLCADGTVVACGNNASGQCNVSKWKSIVAIANDSGNTFGLCEDGTVKWCGESPDSWTYIPNLKNVTRIKMLGGSLAAFYENGKVDVASNRQNATVANWTQIKDIITSFSGIIGLKEDGTVEVAKSSLASMSDGDADVEDWKNIVAIEKGAMRTVGLCADGSVVARGCNNCGQGNVSDWHDVVAIKAHGNLTVGICADGTVVCCGEGPAGVGKVNCSGLKLFNDVADLDENIARNKALRIKAEKAAEERRIAEQKLQEEKRKARVEELEKTNLALKAEISNVKGLFASSKKKKLEQQIADNEAEIRKLMGSIHKA